MTFYVEIWDNSREEWECFKEGFTCAKAANALVDTLMDRGHFPRVRCETD